MSGFLAALIEKQRENVLALIELSAAQGIDSHRIGPHVEWKKAEWDAYHRGMEKSVAYRSEMALERIERSRTIENPPTRPVSPRLFRPRRQGWWARLKRWVGAGIGAW
jgi:hypothetical protein